MITACLCLVAFLAGAALVLLIWSGCLFRYKLRVEVNQSHTNGMRMPHMMSAQLKTRSGKILHFHRVDMREEGWEEELTVNIAKMKHKARALEAAKRIARET